MYFFVPYTEACTSQLYYGEPATNHNDNTCCNRFTAEFLNQSIPASRSYLCCKDLCRYRCESCHLHMHFLLHDVTCRHYITSDVTRCCAGDKQVQQWYEALKDSRCPQNHTPAVLAVFLWHGAVARCPLPQVTVALVICADVTPPTLALFTVTCASHVIQCKSAWQRKTCPKPTQFCLKCSCFPLTCTCGASCA